MYRSALVAAASIVIASAFAYAGEVATVVFPDGWFSLGAGEAGIVFMLRNHGPAVSFDVVDETGRTVDVVALPTGRTVLPQYRVDAGEFRVQFLDQNAKAKAVPGQFAAYGVALTELPATADKPASLLPMVAPFANYTAVAMEQRIAPFVAMGTTDMLAPKKVSAASLVFRLSGEGAEAR